MDTLACVLYLCPNAVLYRDFNVVNNPDGTQVITNWNPALGTQPTQSQLDTAWATVSVQQAQAAQIAALKQSFQAAFTAPVSYMNTTFPADLDTQTLHTHMHVFSVVSGSLPANFYATDIKGVKVPMTQAEYNGLITVVGQQSWDAWSKLQGLIEQVMAATSVGAVEAITW